MYEIEKQFYTKYLNCIEKYKRIFFSGSIPVTFKYIYIGEIYISYNREA